MALEGEKPTVIFGYHKLSEPGWWLLLMYEKTVNWFKLHILKV